MSFDSPPRRVLFVCLGNICRSPAAEAVFARKATAAGLPERGVTWDSCGTGGWHAGNPSDSRMIAAGTRRGYEFTHRARRIRPEDFSEFDLILTMDESNYDDVVALAPSRDAAKKVCPFVEYLTRRKVRAIPDPYYGGPDGFEEVLDLLEDGCDALVAELAGGTGRDVV